MEMTALHISNPQRRASRDASSTVDVHALIDGQRMAMTDHTFQRLSRFISTELGIMMPASKKTMLESRLLKRLRHLGLKNFDAYCDHLFSDDDSEEVGHFLDLATTNKTDFFREPQHFEYLARKLLPEWHRDGRQELRVWSSACSSGEEPYTLAMVLAEFAAAFKGVKFSILASDISARMLATASRAVYHEDQTEPISLALRRKYLLRSRDREKKEVRIAPELRAAVRFFRFNLMRDEGGPGAAVDIIFCRNVIIYFDRPTQEDVLRRLCRHLNPGGYVFMGHSETLNGLDLPLVQVGPTLYRAAAATATRRRV